MTRARVTLYGGVNEIGGNKFLLEEGEARVLLDFGTSIGARNAYFDEFLQPRANSALRDLIRLGLLPRLDGLYREDMLNVARATTDRDLPESAQAWRRKGRAPAVAGILLTHAHVDHFQDLEFVDPDVPVYCTPTTARMLRAIEDVGRKAPDIVTVRERTLARAKGGRFPDAPKVETHARPRRIVEVEDGATVDVGGLRATAVPVDHSVPGGCAFLVVTPSGKRVFYTGDVRFRGRLLARTAALQRAVADLRPDLMLTEGTRVDSERSDAEENVETCVTRLTSDATGLVVAEFGWKDTTRFDTLQRVAEATGRVLLVDPRVAYLLRALDGRADVPSRRIEAYPNVRAYVGRAKSLLDAPGDYPAHELGYVADWEGRRGSIEEEDPAWRADAMAHYERGVRAAEVARSPGRYLVHLSFFSVQELFDLAPPKGSRWIRCATEPYNDEMAMDLAKQRRWMETFALDHNVNEKKGVEDPDLLQGVAHISGHGGREDLFALARAAKPKLVVPVHTAEASLDRFADLRTPLALFRGVGPRDAAAGRCVVEF